MAAGKFGSFVGKMMSKAQKEGTRSGPAEVAEKAKLAEVGRMKKTELEKIASNPESDYYMAAKRELKRREDVRTGTEAKGVRAMGREKAASTKDIREAAERSVQEKRMLDMAKGGYSKKKPVRMSGGGDAPASRDVYDVLGRRVTKEEFDEARKRIDAMEKDLPPGLLDFAKGARERAAQKPKAETKGTKLSDLPLVDQFLHARKMGRFSGSFDEFVKSKEKEKEKPEEKRKGGMVGGYAKGGSVKAFKPCSGCPTPARCKKAGKCLMKEKAKMPSKGSKKTSTGMLVIPVRLAKAPAKKGKKG